MHVDDNGSDNIDLRLLLQFDRNIPGDWFCCHHIPMEPCVRTECTWPSRLSRGASGGAHKV